mgnify:CR=1 FL=1
MKPLYQLVGIDVIESLKYDANNPPKIIIKRKKTDTLNNKNPKVYPLIKNNKIAGFI